jgi:hypothetical protein
MPCISAKLTDVSEDNIALLTCCLLYAGFSLDLFFDPQDGGDIFFRNVGWLPPECMYRDSAVDIATGYRTND